MKRAVWLSIVCCGMLAAADLKVPMFFARQDFPSAGYAVERYGENTRVEHAAALTLEEPNPTGASKHDIEDPIAVEVSYDGITDALVAAGRIEHGRLESAVAIAEAHRNTIGVTEAAADHSIRVVVTVQIGCRKALSELPIDSGVLGGLERAIPFSEHHAEVSIVEGEDIRYAYHSSTPPAKSPTNSCDWFSIRKVRFDSSRGHL